MNVLCSSLSDIRAKSVIVVLRILASDTMMWLNHYFAIILDTIKFNQFTLTFLAAKIITPTLHSITLLSLIIKKTETILLQFPKAHYF